LYSNAARHGSSVNLRVLLEPLFIKYGVDVVFSGHDHVYERIKPQKGIYYFVSGAAGQLRRGNTRPTDETAAYFDQDQSFMLVEVVGDEMSFASISRAGKAVDSGVIRRWRSCRSCRFCRTPDAIPGSSSTPDQAPATGWLLGLSRGQPPEAPPAK
jgi:hypothetical protein